MTQFYHLLQSVFVLVALILCAYWLRQRTIVTDHHSEVFSKLVTDFALPAIIFANLAGSPPIDFQRMVPALVMLFAMTVTALAAWIIGKIMGLSRRVLGAVVLVTGVGSSSTLGYSLVHQFLGDNPAAMSEVVIIGEFGVIVPLFTLGVAVAMYFGKDESVERSFWSAGRPFFYSPIFIALVLGMLVPAAAASWNNWAIQFVFLVLKVIGDALPLLVALTVGLMLKPIELRTIWSLVLLAAILKLVIEPLTAVASAAWLQISALDREILAIEAAMPSGALAAVLAARYGCDGATASALVIATYVLSLAALPLILYVGL